MVFFLFSYYKIQFMKRFNIILPFALVLFVVSSCALKVGFTKNLIDEYDLTERSLKQIQFYTSDYIILKSNRSTSSQNIEGGKIVSSQNNKNYQVIFEPRTKCVLEALNSDGSMVLKFEQGNNKTLKFNVRRNDANGRYYLVADFSDGQKGSLKYEGKEYYIDSGSANAYLLVAIKKLERSYGGSKVVKGMKVY